MRRYAFLGATAALLFSGAVVLAAASPTPTPSPSASARPSASATPSAPPRATSSQAPNGSTKAKPSASPTQSTFSARIQPVEISGSATVTRTKDGAEVTVRVTGLMDAQRWTVDIDAGTLARPNEHIEIAHKSGMDVTRLASDTVRIHLTSSETAAFVRAEKNGGVVALVSDGSRLGAAEFVAS